MKIKYYLTLSKYIGKSFFVWNGVILFVLAFISLLFNVVELTRRAHGNSYIKLDQILKISFLQLPSILDALTPLVVLFATMILLWTLHKRSEITVIRSLGYSIWALITPMVISVIGYSLLYFFLLNPISSSMKEEGILYQDHVFRKAADLSSISKSGLWLKHPRSNGEYSIIHIGRVWAPQIFGNSVIYEFGLSGEFIKRYDIKKIEVQENKWFLKRALLTESNEIQRVLNNITLDINLTLQKIQQTFQPPSSLSFFQLPKFIKLIQKTGLSSTEHTLYFFNLLMKPFILTAMVLVGGVCAFASLRRQDAFVFILSGIFSGFFLHFLHQVFYALGESLQIPLFFAALTPTFISILVGLTLLIHLEEG
jgi:lipopolysaccharide export system permease protein